MAKQFEKGSIYERYDDDGDGVVSDNEMSHAKDIIELELREEKAEAQKRMAWVALLSMVSYAVLPVLPVVSEKRLEAVASISDLLFLSCASIIGMYFGAQAYMSKNK